VIAQYIPTLTPSPSNTSTLTETLVASSTPMNFGTPTRIPPTNTRGPGQLPAPTRTRTPLPTASHTPIPNTNTPIPSPTDTIPPDTDTPIPPPTNTSPPDTDTPIPPDTATPLPIDQQVVNQGHAIQKGSRSFR
jgi:type VI secretion system secreted protein VgrG